MDGRALARSGRHSFSVDRTRDCCCAKYPGPDDVSEVQQGCRDRLNCAECCMGCGIRLIIAGTASLDWVDTAKILLVF